MNQLIVLLIFGTIAFINYLIRQSGSAARGARSRPANPQSAPQRPPPQRQVQTSQSADDERLRKFMEALGVPANTTPPPRKIVRPQPPFVPRAQTPVKRQVAARPIPKPAVVQESSASAQPAYQAETVGMQQQPPPMPSSAAFASQAGMATASTAIDLKSLLKSSSSIRAAMVLKEILGTPKGLQGMDVIPGLR